MTVTLPPELAQFVQKEIASGKYPSEDHVVHEAVYLLKELESRREALGVHVQAGLQQIERGEGIELADDAALRAFFDDIQVRGRARYDASKSTG